MSRRSHVRVLLVHNSYRQAGGEDRVFETEAEMLRTFGDEVVTYTKKNPPHGAAALRLTGQAFWNQETYRDIRRLIGQAAPDIVHLHNTFPLVSPAACYAARRERIPVVLTLHNYRLLCPNGLFFRDGRPCEDCLHCGVPWPGVLHACYRGSRAASLVAGAAIATHWGIGTWARQIDRFVALTDFQRQKFIEGGLPADRISVKPNLVHPDPGPGAGDGGFALFIGRLSPEKGIDTLLAAWRRLAHLIPLTIVGDGPLADLVRRGVADCPSISWLGHLDPKKVQEVLGRATCLIVPSVWYETFGLVVAEAFARGTPAVVSGHGALAELVEHGRTGRHFRAGDPADLAAQVELLLADAAALETMRASARGAYERRYSAERNHATLRHIYAEAISTRGEHTT